MRLVRFIQYLLRQRRHERELAEEIESHRQMVEDRQRAAGLSEQDARHAAHRLMGNATLAREDARGIWIAIWVQSVFQDLGYAARSLRSQPGFTALALLALALATGVNTGLFTMFNANIPRTWPVRDPGRVVRIAGGDGGFSLAECRYLSAHTHALAGLAIISGDSLSTILDGKDDEPDVGVQFVAGNYFSLLDVGMALGRGFAAVEDRMGAPEAVAVLSYTTWQTRYGGDPGIVGRQIRLHDRPPLTVIGVVNQKFSARANHHLWAPLAFQSLVKVPLAHTDPSGTMVARLAPGVSREQARAELTILSRQFRSGIGKPPHDVTLSGVTRLDQIPTVTFDPTAAVLLAAFGSILLLACANVSNLLLARAAARQREIAVRVCIGAGRVRIVRQLLTESLLLAALGSGLGLLLAYVLLGIFGRRFGLVLDLDVTPDLTVLAFTIAFAVFTAALFGLAPALRATRTGVGEAMKQQGAHASPRFPSRGVLLGVQVAISVTLLLVAGVLTRGLWHARSFNPGYKTNGVATIRVTLPSFYDPARDRAFFDAVVQQLRPFGPIGIGSPPPGGASTRSITLTGEKTATVRLTSRDVNADYFDVLGIPIVAGRNFVPADGKLRNILVNETMARRYWPGQTPIGKSVLDAGVPLEIIGVVRDSQLAGPGSIEPTVFKPASMGIRLLVPAAASKAVVEVVRRTEPRARVTSAPLSDQFESFLTGARVAAYAAISLGTLALLPATVGVYGVISYSVEQRRREIGVRMALGAQPGEILGFVLRSNARAVVIGTAVGLAVFLAGSKVLESLLYGLSRFDPLAHGAVLAVLLAAAAAACLIPARRATRIAPVEALRHD